MSALSAIARGRASVEAQMTDTCQIGTETKGAVLDETTDEYQTVFTVLYDGPCLFRAGVRLGNEVDAAGQPLFVQNAVVKVPIEGTETLGKKGNIVVVTGSQTDPGLVGTRARVTGPFAQTYATSRRLPVVVVT
jgi:hypothetical protein